jgi:anti-sigma regulatory factor (Ser/Thr protein kinase)
MLPSTTAPRQARRALRQLDLPPALAATAALLVSELVTNSVRHARLAPNERIGFSVDWSGRRLRVHVRDRVPGSDRRGSPPASGQSIRPTPGAESGWGLYLVDRLASRWGIDAGGYWFELDDQPRPDRPVPPNPAF